MLAGYPAPSTPPWWRGWAGGEPGAGMRDAGQAQLRRVRDGLGQRELGLRPGASNPWDARACPAARRAARRRRWRRGCCRRPPAPTPAARSASRPASAASPASSRPTACAARYGMIAFASSLDQAGPMARSAEDCALLLSAMSGFDARDATSAERPPQDFRAPMRQAREGASAARPLQGLRIGLPKRVLPRGAGRRRGRRRARRAGRAGKARRHAGGREPAAHRTVDPGLLHHRAGRGQLQPVAASTACVRPPRRAVRRPAGHVQEDARRGLRPRGQAPHHDRHLRAQPRLLRRLLPAGAEAAPHDRRRLPGLLRSSAT
jgi:hypothetical protein